MKKPKDISALTKTELTSLARRKKIKVASSLTKDDLVKAVKKGLRKLEAAKTSPAAAGKKSPVKKSKNAAKSKQNPKASKKAATKTSANKITAKNAVKKKAVKSKTAVKKKVVKKSAAAAKSKTKKAAVKKAAGAKTPARSRKPAKAAARQKTVTQTAVKKKTAKKAAKKPTTSRKPAIKKSVPRKAARKAAPKKSTPRKTAPPPKAGLPKGYGDNRLVAMARDPYWAYAYWDLAPDRIDELSRQARREAGHPRWILRAYSAPLHPVADKGSFFDVEIDVHSGSYYCNLSRPGARFILEIGVVDTSGLFHSAAQSNPVIMPLDHPVEGEAESEMRFSGSSPYRAPGSSWGGPVSSGGL